MHSNTVLSGSLLHFGHGAARACMAATYVTYNNITKFCVLELSRAACCNLIGVWKFQNGGMPIPHLEWRETRLQYYRLMLQATGVEVKLCPRRSVAADAPPTSLVDT